MNVVIQSTADGSHTLFVPQLNEHYHSVNGAIQESTHIFINAGLHHCAQKEVNILEIGFGTGLNTLLTLIDAKQNGLKINYTAIEYYPLPIEIIKQLNYPQDSYQQKLFHEIHNCEWNVPKEIEQSFSLTKIRSDATIYDFTSMNNINVIYFDAFAPDKQPDIWTQDIFDKLFSVLNTNGIFVTYCAKGVVRRMLQQSGFMVERLPGPPGKREMLRATKQSF